ncbi:hypothetical protein ACFYZ2_00425 [Streptomyces sviceus]|uniref:hypothetical protein n=1 Tax=Streptomyces sviceus TaxID=285530 RepID=UPI0036CD4DB4
MTQGREAAGALRGAVGSVGTVRAVDGTDGTDLELAPGGTVAVLGLHRTEAGTVRLFGAVRADAVGAMPHQRRAVARDIVRELSAFTNGRCPSPPRVAGALEPAGIPEPAGRHGDSLSSGRGRGVGRAVTGRHRDTLSSSRGQRVGRALAERHGDPLTGGRPRCLRYAVAGRHRDLLARDPVGRRTRRVRWAVAVSGEPGLSVLDEPGHPPAPEAVLVRGVCPRLLGSYAVLSYRRHAGHL